MHHPAARSTVEADGGPFHLLPTVLAEVGYLVLEHLGREVEEVFLEDVAERRFSLVDLDADLVAGALGYVRRHRALDLGVTDASIMAAADRLGLHRILTLDERDFRAVTPRGGEGFVVLPADG